MPKCGHTLRRDVTANLLSTVLSLWFFHHKLGTRFNFSTGDVGLSDHHTSTGSLTLAEWVCPLREKMLLFTTNLPTLKKKKHLAPDPQQILFLPPTIKGVRAATNQKAACKQKYTLTGLGSCQTFLGGGRVSRLSGLSDDECVIWVCGAARPYSTWQFSLSELFIKIQSETQHREGARRNVQDLRTAGLTSQTEWC